MNSRLYIPALITLGLGILSGCGGSSSSEQAYLPIGLQRTLDITLPNGLLHHRLRKYRYYLHRNQSGRLNGIHSCCQLQAFLRFCGTNRLLLVVQ